MIQCKVWLQHASDVASSVFQPDCLDDLAYAIMYEISKLSYRVSDADVTRARNQVPFLCTLLLFFLVWCIFLFILGFYISKLWERNN